MSKKSDIISLQAMKPTKQKHQLSNISSPKEIKKNVTLKEFTLASLGESPLYRTEYYEYCRLYKKYYDKSFNGNEIEKPKALPDGDKVTFIKLNKSYEAIQKIFKQYEEKKANFKALFFSLSDKLNKKNPDFRDIVYKILPHASLGSLRDLNQAIHKINNVKNSYKLNIDDISAIKQEIES